MREAVGETPAELVGLEARLKPLSSIERKVDETVRRSRGAVTRAEVVAAGIDDAVRFRVVVDDGHYVTTEQEVVAFLERSGVKALRRPDGWGRQGDYPGLNVTFRHPTGSLFEVQFHTPASLQALIETRQWYEQMKTARGAEYRRLRSLTGQVFRQVPMPPGLRRRYD